MTKETQIQCKSIQEEENNLYILFTLLQFVSNGNAEKKLRMNGLLGASQRKNIISICRDVTPSGTEYRETYVYLIKLFSSLGIHPQVIIKSEAYIRLSKIDKYKEYLHGENVENESESVRVDFLLEKNQDWADNELLSNLYIINNFVDEDIIKLEGILDQKIEIFVNDEISNIYGLPTHSKQRNILIQKLSEGYGISGDCFTLDGRIFEKYAGFSEIFTIALLWKVGYLELHTPMVSYYEEKIEHTHLVNTVVINEKGMELFNGLNTLRDKILDKIFDEDYKRISISRKNGELHMMEGEKEIEAGMIKFIDIQKQYPYSDIEVKNHGGKAKKYRIKEKIKLDKESTKNKT